MYDSLFLRLIYLDYYGETGETREPMRISGELDGTLSLQCPLEGQVTWSKDGAPLPPTAQQVQFRNIYLKGLEYKLQK